MRALLLVAGLGSRYAATSGSETPKCLVKVGDHYVADFALETIVQLKLEKIVMVIGHKGELVQKVYGNSYKGIPITYAYQEERLGLVHAMACGQKQLDGEDFWLFLGDEIFLEANQSSLLKTFTTRGAYVVCGMIPTTNLEQIHKNYTIDFDPTTLQMRHLVEKPTTLYNHFIGTGSCLFKGEIFQEFEQVPVDPRTGRRELASIIQYQIDQGRVALCQQLDVKFYVNVNTYQDYLDLEKRLQKVRTNDQGHFL